MALVPSHVPSSCFRWKISTRGRKNSLEAALQSADYSQHHPVPVYGFRYADDWGHGTKEHRQEQRRLEARALAAERAALERRSRAEGGAEGAAFARAMSRRALARADRIQKVIGFNITMRSCWKCSLPLQHNVHVSRKSCTYPMTSFLLHPSATTILIIP